MKDQTILTSEEDLLSLSQEQVIQLRSEVATLKAALVKAEAEIKRLSKLVEEYEYQ